MIDIICAIISAVALIGSKIVEVTLKDTGNKEKHPDKKSSSLTNTLLVLILLVCLFNSVTGIMGRWIDSPPKTTASEANPDSTNGPEQEQLPSSPILQDDNPLSSTPVGKTLSFGRYQQDNITDQERDIEWLVIKREEDRVLLFSVNGLDTQQYNKIKGSTCWDSCSLRSWLNDTFFGTAFNKEEQAKILLTPIIQDENPGDSECEQGPTTTDRVFLLSASEYRDLVYSAGNVSEKYRPGKPVPRIKKSVDTHGPEQYCWSLLRTSAKDNKCISSITAYGEIDYYTRETHESGGLIRPAIWVSVD